MGYYELILAELKKRDTYDNGWADAKENTRSLFFYCEKYYQAYRMHKNLSTANHILSQYRSSDSDGKKLLTVKNKQYIDFFWKAYTGYYREENKPESKFLESLKKKNYVVKEAINTLWPCLFSEQMRDENKIKEEVRKSVMSWYHDDGRPMKKVLVFDRLSKAMSDIKREINRPKLAQKTCVEAVLKETALYLILEWLKADNLKLDVHVGIETSRLRVALTTEREKSLRKKYFQLPIRYTLGELTKRNEILKDEYFSYNETQKKLNRILREYHYIP